jgi:maltose alpha-D-glucosyltransferase/alpha-amylase
MQGGYPVAAPENRATDPLWYKDAVIYETHVKAFHDANGDGIGDLRGLIDKLDYLQALGIDCLWLLPLFPSPQKDDGYDISDYRAIHPDYGTLEDFGALVEAAHARGIRIVVELVVNHTSDQHPWFQAARRAPRDSPERSFYVWSDTEERYRDARIIFTDTEKSNWTWDPEARQYYWHRFFSHQPDLNFDNPAVLEGVLEVLRFWGELGVDGFRLDAVPYLVERDGTSCENLPETHTVIRKLRAFVDQHFPGRMLLAEANQWPADVRPYFGEGDECHMAFHFPLMPRIFLALRLEDVEPIIEIMNRTPAIPDSCQWALFLRNHDELTLEMVSSDERDYMYLAYGLDPRAKLNVGIRRRLAPLMDNSRRRIELLHALLFSFPGTPIIYYGDEIGMGDNIYLHDRNGVRTPMQWSPDRNAGFSRADPGRLYSAPISDPVYGYQAINVEGQERDSSSLLHWMRNIIALRKLFQAFGRGSMEILPVKNRRVLAYVRRLDEDVILCVANVSRFAQPAELDLSAFEGYVPVEMLGYTEFPRVGRLPYFLTLGPYGYYWFELRRGG